jgi:hypothetical protein
VRAASALLLILAACAGPPLADAEVTAAPAPGGVRVRFRRLGGADPDRPPELRAEHGALGEVVVSPDLRTISAVWRSPAGALTCRFPYDGIASFDAGATTDPSTVAYVLLDAEDVRVTADLPRGCLLLPALPLRLHAAEALEPARIVHPDGRSLRRDGDLWHLPLTADERGILRRGDMAVTVETARGPMEFLVGIDDDGTPAAVSGYVASDPEDAQP